MHYPNSIEEVSYHVDHIEKVLTEIRLNFTDFFNEFVSTEKGNSPSENQFSELAGKFNLIVTEKKKKKTDTGVLLKRIIDESILDYEKDRKRYLDILDIELLSDYTRNPTPFHRQVLKNECPIIHSTIQNVNAKELDKYRYDFNVADSGKLLQVVKNITQFGNEFSESVYNVALYENAKGPKELKLDILNSDDYIAYGVIGGGIKSHFLYKMNPQVFPNRSREAIWALWYLTSKKSFGCKQDSEFLMVSIKENITQQNYFYPYELFVFYAIQILELIRKESAKVNVMIEDEYQFVILDSFLSFIAQKHQTEINDLKRKIKVDGYN